MGVRFTVVEVASQMMETVVETAVPVAIVIELSNILISTFLRAAFGGRMWFGR